LGIIWERRSQVWLRAERVFHRPLPAPRRKVTVLVGHSGGRVSQYLRYDFRRTPSIVRGEAVEWRRRRKRAPIIPSCHHRENGCTECGTCPSPTAGALLPPPGGGGVPGAPPSIP